MPEISRFPHEAEAEPGAYGMAPAERKCRSDFPLSIGKYSPKQSAP